MQERGEENQRKSQERHEGRQHTAAVGCQFPVPRPEKKRTYLFGDNDRALERLHVLARVFGPATETFLRRHRDRHPPLGGAVIFDLGCGPGRTTRLLADVFEQKVIGLDNSEALLWEARRLGPERVGFDHFDASRDELPREADLVFGRFLLTHLPSPDGRVRAWGRRLRASGCLLSEEVEDIETDNAAFVRYLEIVRRALERRGGKLYVGPELGSLDPIPRLRVADSLVVGLDVTDTDAARMFSLNLPTLMQTREVRAIADREELETLQHELDDIAYSGSTQSSIRWSMRQIVWQAER